MKPAKTPTGTKVLEAENQITDIVLFFAEITKAYVQFEQNITLLNNNIPSLTPEQLLRGCTDLRTEKTRLEALDKKMFDILDLAGAKIKDEKMVEDYRMALAEANMAADELFYNLKSVKETLWEKICELFDEEIIERPI